jgi:hypothetical protein
MELPPPEALVVFALIGAALVLFISEAIPNDVTAIGVMFALGAPLQLLLAAVTTAGIVVIWGV